MPVNTQNVVYSIFQNVYVSGTHAIDRKMRRMSQRIPAPPDPPRPHTLSIRLSDEEKDELEKTMILLAAHWKREKVERADVIRAGLKMLHDELKNVAPRS